MINGESRFLAGALTLIVSAVSLTIRTDQAAAQVTARRPPPPPVLQVEPNTIKDPNVPVTVSIQSGGQGQGQKLYLFILRACEVNPSDAEIDEGECGPLWQTTWDKRPITLRLGKLTQPDGRPLPVDTPLWLRVSATPSGKRYKRDTLLSVTSNPCTVVRTLLNPLTGGRCHAGVRAAFMAQKGIMEELPSEALEVRRLDIAKRLEGKKKEAIRMVPGTVGATGVQWLGTDQMVVTLRAPTAREREAAALPPDGRKRLEWSKPGLYRIDLRTGKKEQLYRSPKHTIAGAPYAISRDRVVFIEELEYQPKDDSKHRLVIWERGRKTRKYPIERSLHQVFHVDRKNRAILAYSLWKRSPTVVRVSLEHRKNDYHEVDNLGGDPELLHMLRYSERNRVAVQAIENNASEEYGWEIILVDHKGEMAHELLVGKGHDLMPVWRPDEAEIAYLGQVER